MAEELPKVLPVPAVETQHVIRLTEGQFWAAVEAVLNYEHDMEMERCGAEVYNFGWGTTNDSIASKTSKGVLESNIDTDSETLEVKHIWAEDESEEEMNEPNT